ncbi:MAG: tetratricopeptide repeat protein [Armatimonadetes bacterium]|nr:tetratricopeptide repeat protein [Armatimonadota bacterium]
MNIAPADWAVLVLYFLFIGAVGIVAGRQVKDTSHYFLGKRGFGKWLMMGQSFGVGTHAEMPVSLAGAVSQMGFSGIWFQWKNLFATPFFWLFAPLLRRIRRTTIAELTEDRYGLWMGGLYMAFALVFFTINSAGMLKGAGKVISQAAGGQLGANEIVVAMTVLFVLYSFIGGLVAAAWTDFFQGFLIILLSFMLIPLGWGGLPSAPAMELYKLRVVAPSAPSGLRAALTDREYRRWRRARESLRQADPQAALRRLLPLCHHHPEQVRLLTVLGVAYAMAEEPGKARTCLRRALQIDPAHAPAWFNLARIYGRLGRKRKMLGCLAQALKANPRHAKARKAAARYGLALPPLPSDDPLAWEAPAAEPWWGPASGPSFEDFAGPDPAG